MSNKGPETNQTNMKKTAVGKGNWDETMICSVADETMMRFLGFNAHRAFIEIVAGADRERFTKAWNNAMQGKNQELTLRLERIDGEFRSVLLRMEPLHRQAAEPTEEAAENTKEADGCCNKHDTNRNELMFGNEGHDGVHIELTDIEEAALQCTALTEERDIIAFYLGSRDGIFFEYTFREKSMSFFRYEQEIRVMEAAPGYEEQLRKIVNRYCYIDGNVDYFKENFQYEEAPYFMDAVVVFRDYVVDRIFGHVRRGIERRENPGIAPETDNNSNKNIDSFTGLYDKVSALDYARKRIEMEDGHQVLMAMIDLDFFKTVNDTYGHIFGDEVIRKMALILKEAVKGKGIAARFGGDEFLLVMENVGAEGSVRSVLETIQTQLQWAFTGPDNKPVVSCTIGIAEYPRNGATFDIIFKKADRALYIGKQKGRSRYIIYKEYLHGELSEQENTNIEQRIQESLNTSQFVRNVSWCINTLCKGGSANLDMVMERLMGLYCVDRVNIYLGTELELSYSFGKRGKNIPSMEVIRRPAFMELFDEDGRCHIDFSRMKSGYYEDLHGKLQKNGIHDTTMLLIGTKERCKGLVCYDILHTDVANSRKWSSEELHILLLCTQLIGSLIC